MSAAQLADCADSVLGEVLIFTVGKSEKRVKGLRHIVRSPVCQGFRFNPDLASEARLGRKKRWISFFFVEGNRYAGDAF
jgi:hypothetical protein